MTFGHKKHKKIKPVRNKVVPIRFTTSEVESIKVQIQPFHISISEFVRRAALKRKMPAQSVSEINRKSYKELCRIGNNLNQLLKHLNGGILTNVKKEFLIELKEIVQAVGFVVVGVKP